MLVDRQLDYYSACDSLALPGSSHHPPASASSRPAEDAVGSNGHHTAASHSSSASSGSPLFTAAVPLHLPPPYDHDNGNQVGLGIIVCVYTH